MEASTAAPLTRKRKIAAVSLTLLCALVALEAVSYGVGRYLQAKWCMYRIPVAPTGRVVPDYAEYLRRRDPLLGWPFPDQFGGELFNATGARPSPAFPETTPETSVLSLYGDSFTQSANSDAEAWGNVLASLSGCPVANYGQGGYGTDQAYLRYKANTRDHSPVVILSHVTENIIRNITRNRDLILSEMWYAYKPRFILAPDGSLELVPLPTLSEQEHMRLEGMASPPFLLEHEAFCPGGPAGVTMLRFPYTWSVVRNFADFRLRAALAGRSANAEFYRPGHPFQSLEITREIFKAFVAEAKSRGQSALVVLFPNRKDVEQFRKSKEWDYAPLAKELASAGLEFIEFGPELAEYAGERGLDELYDGTGHFKPETDRKVAEFVLARLRSLPLQNAPRCLAGN